MRKIAISGGLLLITSFLSGCPSSGTAVRSKTSEDSVLSGQADSAAVSANENSNRRVDADPMRASSSAEVKPNKSAPPADFQWSRRRLIALSTHGPTIIDLHLSVGGDNLLQAGRRATDVIIGQLLGEPRTPKPWEKVLEDPLVKSGWLGNLLPEGDEQQEQIIALYDLQRDGLADESELPAFLTRGLSRSGALQISDEGIMTGAAKPGSPWGPADMDSDYALDSEELAALPVQILALDSDGDQVVTFREAAQPEMPESESMTSEGLLVSETLLVHEFPPTQVDAAIAGADSLSVDDNEQERQSARRRAQRALLRKLVAHYSFLGQIDRPSWTGWSDERWHALDQNDNMQLDGQELNRVLEIKPDIAWYIAFDDVLPDSSTAFADGLTPLGEGGGKVDDSGATTASMNRQSESQGDMANAAEPLFDPKFWCETTQAGILGEVGFAGGHWSDNCSDLTLRLRDQFGRGTIRDLENALQRALTDSTVADAIVQQMGLSEGAIELLDLNGNSQLEDAEFERLRTWIAVRQGARLRARWTQANPPWLYLVDEDANQAVSTSEAHSAVERIQSMDRDGDGRITPIELPLTVQLELLREDLRLTGFTDTGPAQDNSPAPVPADWFSAMDVDGNDRLDWQEFIGDQDDFDRYDSNNNRLIEHSEAFPIPPSR